MNNFSLREIKAGEPFDPLTLCPVAPFTQAEFYGLWQKNLGRKISRFLINDRNEPIAYFQLIKYPLSHRQNYFYIPYGPVIKILSEQFLTYFRSELLKIAKRERVVFTRLDFTPPPSDALRLKKFFQKSFLCTYRAAYFQPRTEWFLSLTKSEDEIFRAIHEKTRYSIKLAGRKGIISEIVTGNFSEYFEIFYELLLETAQRNGFHLHEIKYYQSIFDNLQFVPKTYLVVARYQDKILVVNLIIIFGQTANYVFGGSSNQHRNLCASYSAQWAAICHAKELGCCDYNFGGVATDDKIYRSWDGLTRFKQRFGGRQIIHSDFYDLVTKPFWYWLYNFAKLIKWAAKGLNL